MSYTTSRSVAEISIRILFPMSLYDLLFKELDAFYSYFESEYLPELTSEEVDKIKKEIVSGSFSFDALRLRVMRKEDIYNLFLYQYSLPGMEGF